MRNRILSVVSVLSVLVLLLCVSSSAFASGDDISVMLNGRQISFDSAPVVVDNVIMVEVRPLAKALGLDVKWTQNTQSVKLTNSKTSIILKVDYEAMMVTDMTDSEDSDYESVSLPVSPMVIDGSTFVPVRSVAESLDIDIFWDSEDSSVKLSRNGYEYDSEDDDYTSYVGDSGHTFYFQNQSDWNLPGYGSGYCWTVSYAMLISDVTGTVVTPVDVADVNKRKSGNGSYCYHWDIINKFGVEFIPALDVNSPYYGGRDSNSGGTRVDCDNEYEAVEALKEALDRNPAGVMVRYAAYPHTMVAVGYEGDTILFNEPMQTSRSYMDESPKENVPFEETCVGKRGIDIEDITFIQALAVK